MVALIRTRKMAAGSSLGTLHNHNVSGNWTKNEHSCWCLVSVSTDKADFEPKKGTTQQAYSQILSASVGLARSAFSARLRSCHQLQPHIS